MSNIATVFVRLMPDRARREANTWRPAISTVELLSILLDDTDGDSYHVPIWAGHADGCFDVQYGAKHSPGTAPFELWKRRTEADVSAIWVRYYNDGGDYDDIIHVDGPEASVRRCRYGFDAIEADIGGDIARHVVTGSYRGANSRCSLSNRPRIPSLTTFAVAESAAGDIAPADAAAVVADLRARATALRFFWRGRLVRVGHVDRHGWSDTGLDSWDNCVDEGYLTVVDGR